MYSHSYKVNTWKVSYVVPAIPLFYAPVVSLLCSWMLALLIQCITMYKIQYSVYCVQCIVLYSIVHCAGCTMYRVVCSVQCSVECREFCEYTTSQLGSEETMKLSHFFLTWPQQKILESLFSQMSCRNGLLNGSVLSMLEHCLVIKAHI